MVNFPGSLDSLSNPTPTTRLTASGFEHSTQHSNLNDIAELVEKVLVGPAVFNAKGYGAVGDGSANDQAALQAANDAANAAGGGILFCPPGTFKVNTALNLSSNVTLRGAGIDLTTIKAGATGITTVNVPAAASNVAVEDLTINGNRAAFSTGAGICFGGPGNVTGLRLSNCRFTNGQKFSVFLDTSAGGWTRGRIHNCLFEDSGQGFDTFGSGQLTDFIISDCLFRNTTGQGFATTNSVGGLIIQGCHFTGPMGNGISLEPAGHVLITGCTFHNLNDVALAIRVTPVAGLASDPTDIAIVGNAIYNTGTVNGLLTDYGIQLKNTTAALITGNTIRRMGRAGILIESATIADSANVTKNIVISGNVVIDANQDNAATTPAVYLLLTAGTLQQVTVTGNQLVKVAGDSNSTHGILESGAVAYGLYVGNDIQGHATAAIGLGTGTTSNYALNQGFNGVIGTNASVSVVPLMIRGFSDTVPLQEWGDGTGAVFFRVIRTAANVMKLDSSSALVMPSTDIADGATVKLGTGTGTKFGTATNEKIGFWNKAPAVQPAAVADATDAATVITQLNALLARLRTIGIIAT